MFPYAAGFVMSHHLISDRQGTLRSPGRLKAVGPFAWNERHPRLRRGPAEDRDFSLRRPNNQIESPRYPSVFADETRTTARDKAPSTPLSGPVLLKDIDEMVQDKDRKTNDA
jgi:hypothetical protein